jgi:WD40 repeat protein
MVFSPDGRELWTTSLDGSIIRWDVEGRRSLFPRLDRPLQPTTTASTPDRNTLRFHIVQPGGRAVYYAFQGQILVRKLFANSNEPSPPIEIADPVGGAFSPDGHAFYVMEAHNTARGLVGRVVRRFDTSSHALTATLPPTDNFTSRISATRRGAVVARISDEDGSLLGFLQLDGTSLERLGDPVAVRDTWNGLFAASPGGRYVAYVRFDDDQFKRTSLVIVDLQERRVSARVRLPAQPGTIVFDRTGERIALGTGDGRVIMVDRRSGAVTAISDIVSDGAVSDVLFTKFGVVTGQTDGLVTILDARSLRTVGVLDPAPGNYQGELGLHDGHVLITSLADPQRAVAAFGLRPSSWLAHACKLAGPDLPASHWREVLPDREHVKPCA